MATSRSCTHANPRAPACMLCSSADPALFFAESGRRYWHCAICDLRFLDPPCRLSPEAERARYLLHENDPGDPGYRAFLQPLHDLVVRQIPRGGSGLDFGAGPTPVLAQMLRDSGYAVQTYDPFFDPVPERLGHRYDFIVACEVIEHLFDPHAELLTLRGLLRDGGVLALMTALWTPDVDFASWHYCRDPAHVAFYSRATFGWIADRFDFRAPVFVPPRVVALRA